MAAQLCLLPRSSLNPLSDDAFKLSRWSTAETLIYLDADGNALEGLATTWKRENDTTWRFTIRDGVTFHDNTPAHPPASRPTPPYADKPSTILQRPRPLTTSTR